MLNTWLRFNKTRLITTRKVLLDMRVAIQTPHEEQIMEVSEEAFERMTSPPDVTVTRRKGLDCPIIES